MKNIYIFNYCKIYRKFQTFFSAKCLTLERRRSVQDLSIPENSAKYPMMSNMEEVSLRNLEILRISDSLSSKWQTTRLSFKMFANFSAT